MPDGFKWEDVDTTVELPEIYDGWSIAILKDGTMRNRWAGEGSEREKLVNEYIARAEEGREE